MQARKHWRIMQVRGWTLPEVNVDLGLIGWQDWKALGKLWMGGAPYMWVQGGPKVYLHILSSIQVSFSPPHPSPLLSLSFYAQRICLRDTHSLDLEISTEFFQGEGFQVKIHLKLISLNLSSNRVSSWWDTTTMTTVTWRPYCPPFWGKVFTFFALHFHFRSK